MIQQNNGERAVASHFHNGNLVMDKRSDNRNAL